MNRTTRSDILIVGGGAAGLAVARALAREGASVVLAERGRVGEGTSRVAAGMLAPMVEARLEERALVRFGVEALRYYKEFAPTLQEETGIDIDYRSEGTLVVGVHRDDVQDVRHLYDEQRELGLEVEWLGGYECRQLEPHLSATISGGVFSSDDRQVDNRALLRALATACRDRHGVRIIEDAGEGLAVERTRSGWRVGAGEGAIECETLVVATGAYRSGLHGALPRLDRIVRPVKGQILRLDQSRSPLLEHVVRTPEVYLVPKSNGDLVVGASSEDKGFDESVTAGEIMEILRSAWETVPGTYELPIAEIAVGFRPAAIDNAPLLGQLEDRLWLAMGYYRHGILFSPYAAELLAGAIVRGEKNEWLERFTPTRHHETHAQWPTD